MAENKTYAVGDKFADGIVTRVGTNNGHPEYTVAVEDESLERPIDIGPRVHPAAFTNGPIELAEANQKTYDKVAEESAKAQKELDKDAEEDGDVRSSDPKDVRKETVTPDPAVTPAGNASAAPKSAVKNNTSAK